MINTQPRIRRRFRYSGVVSSTVPVNITRACLLSQLLNNGNTNNQTSHVVPFVYSAIRLLSVEVWTPQNITGASPTGAPSAGVSLEFASDLGFPKKYTRMTLSSTASKFRVSPPPKSRASFPSSAGALSTTMAEVIFVLSVEDSESQTGNVPVVLDLMCECLTVDQSPSVLNLTTAAATTIPYGVSGNWLDVLTTSGSIGPLSLAPVGLPLPLSSAAITAISRTG
jgi:hypothetical protein